MTTSTDAFVPGPRVMISGASAGPLAGLTFAVKDLIDVAGAPTLGGSPDWRRFYPAPTRHAAVVQVLLDAGASVVGKTITDEVSLGILGENAHDGTPLNPAAPDRVPGGSSSGSASAVASGACDFALGTDTGGSVRVPASFCGLYGIRPTHGRIDFAGIAVQAPSADTCGWFTRDARTFARVAEVLFGTSPPEGLPTCCWSRWMRSASPTRTWPRRSSLCSTAWRRWWADAGTSTLAPQGLSVWQRAQRVLQSSEAWKTFEPWLDRCDPRLAWSVARGLVQGSMLTDAERGAASLMRIEARARLRQLLPPGTILCMPTTPFPAPPKGLPVHELMPLRERISCLTSHGGLTGVPQLNLPGATVNGAPVGLSIVGGRGADLDLVRVAVALEG